MKMNNIEVVSNLLNVIEKVSSTNYTYKDGYADAWIEVKENGKMIVSGKGSKKINAYIKGCIEQYENDMKHFEADTQRMSNLLETIAQLSKGKIEFENAQLYKEGNEYLLFVNVKRMSDELGYHDKLGYITINTRTLEIVEYKARRNHDELMNKFLVAYNKMIRNEVPAPAEPTEEQKEETKESYIVGDRIFDTYTEAEKYCNDNDFDPSLMIERGQESIQIEQLEARIDTMEKEIESIKTENNIPASGIMYGTTDAHKKIFSLLDEIKSTEDKIDTLYKLKKERLHHEHAERSRQEHANFNENKYVVYYSKGFNLIKKEYVNSIDIEQYKNMLGNDIDHIRIGLYNESVQNSKEEGMIILDRYELWLIANILYLHEYTHDEKGRLLTHYINGNLFRYHHYEKNCKDAYVLNGICKVVHIGINVREVIEIVDGDFYYYDSYGVFSRREIKAYEVLNHEQYKKVYSKAPEDVKMLLDRMLGNNTIKEVISDSRAS